MTIDLATLKGYIETSNHEALFQLILTCSEADQTLLLANQADIFSFIETKETVAKIKENNTATHLSYNDLINNSYRILLLLGLRPQNKNTTNFKYAMWDINRCKSIPEIKTFVQQIKKLNRHNSLFNEQNKERLGRYAQREEVNIQEREAFSSKLKTYQSTVESHTRNKTMLAFLTTIIQTGLLTEPNETGSVTKTELLLFPYLTECACPSHHRKQTQHRQHIERDILKHAKQFPRDEALTYVSLGSGGLLQDFITLTQLIKDGHTNLEVFLIDTHYKSHDIEKQKEQFDLLRIAAEQQGGSLKTSYFSNISEFFKAHPQKEIHVASFIDLAGVQSSCSPALTDIASLTQHLDPRGKLFFSYTDLCYFIFDQKSLQNPDFLTEEGKEMALNDPKRNRLIPFLEKTNQQKDNGNNTLHCLLHQFEFRDLVMLLPLLAQSTATRINIYIAKPGKKVPDFSAFLSLLMPNKTITMRQLNPGETIQADPDSISITDSKPTLSTTVIDLSSPSLTRTVTKQADQLASLTGSNEENTLSLQEGGRPPHLKPVDTKNKENTPIPQEPANAATLANPMHFIDWISISSAVACASFTAGSIVQGMQLANLGTALSTNVLFLALVVALAIFFAATAITGGLSSTRPQALFALKHTPIKHSPSDAQP